MEALQEFLEPLEKYLNVVLNTLNKVPLVGKAIDEAASKSGQKKTHIIALILLLKAFVIFFVFGLRGVGYLCGFVIPFFESWKAIRSEELDDDKKWLVYWVVYSFITTMEGLSDFVLSWIPFYEVLKIALYISLWHERTEGAQILLDVATKGASKVQAKVAEKLSEDNKKIY